MSQVDRSQLSGREQPWGGLVPSVHGLIIRHTDAYMQKYGDRVCPQCSGAKRGNWLNSTLQLTIPQATYFQVVFTLPEQLSSLALAMHGPCHAS
jgi:hypothetical protein